MITQSPFNTCMHNLSQELETGCSDLTIVNILSPILEGRLQYTQITTINMYLVLFTYQHKA